MGNTLSGPCASHPFRKIHHYSAVCLLPFLKNFLTHVSGRSKLRMVVGRSKQAGRSVKVPVRTSSLHHSMFSPVQISLGAVLGIVRDC